MVKEHDGLHRDQLEQFVGLLLLLILVGSALPLSAGALFGYYLTNLVPEHGWGSFLSDFLTVFYRAISVVAVVFSFQSLSSVLEEYAVPFFYWMLRAPETLWNLTKDLFRKVDRVIRSGIRRESASDAEDDQGDGVQTIAEESGPSLRTAIREEFQRHDLTNKAKERRKALISTFARVWFAMFMIGFALLIFSARLKPVVFFSWNVDPTVTDGIEVRFSDLSQDLEGQIERREWNFGEPGSYPSSKKIVSHRYKQGGDYPVTLTVTNDGGRTSTQTLNIHLEPQMEPRPPIAAFVVERDGPVFHFSDRSDDAGGKIAARRWIVNPERSQDNEECEGWGTEDRVFSAKLVPGAVVRLLVRSDEDRCGTSDYHVSEFKLPPSTTSIPPTTTTTLPPPPIQLTVHSSHMNYFPEEEKKAAYTLEIVEEFRLDQPYRGNKIVEAPKRIHGFEIGLKRLNQWASREGVPEDGLWACFSGKIDENGNYTETNKDCEDLGNPAFRSFLDGQGPEYLEGQDSQSGKEEISKPLGFRAGCIRNTAAVDETNPCKGVKKVSFRYKVKVQLAQTDGGK